MSRKVSSVVVRLAVSLVAAGCSGGAGTGGGVPSDTSGGSGGGAGTGGGSGGGVGTGSGASGGAFVGNGGSAGTGATGGGAATSGTGGGAGSGGSLGGSGAGTGGAATTGGTAGSGGAGGTGGGAGSSGMAGTGGTPNCTATTLKEAASCTGRLFGAALAASHLSESDYAAAAREHNFVTPENEMKWDQIEPTRGNFDFGPADQIVNFAMQNGMQIKGHTLVWHKQLPSWVTDLSSAADVRSAMLDHINGVMSHYRGMVTAWDVVNEAWLTDGRTGEGNPRIRESVFSTALGPSFIDEAFTAAREADPDALLIYNEFANEGLSDKANSVYDMLKDMKDRGIPIDGVGLQMHIGINTNPTAADVATNMQRLADLGLKIYISEMDVNGCAGYSLDQERAQYHDMVAACVAQPACEGITVWGITDKYSWLNIDQNSNSAAGCENGQSALPLLWDDDYGKKPAYTGVMDALLGQ